MAQQTQISRVVAAWTQFVERFPTPAALADSSPADVLRAWQGMGYDRRALNLRRAAAAIVADHGGLVPADVAALERLPGIGPYTARAVASIAFGRPVGAVDTNVRRVLGRSLAGDPTPAPAWLQAAADASVDRVRPGDWTHAVMDIGATVCKPRSPDCGSCPLEPWCRFAAARAGAAPGGSGRVGPSGSVRDVVAAAPGAGTVVTALRAGRSGSGAGSSARHVPPFEQTTRWLRGRIVDRLRAADGESWTSVSGPIGAHPPEAVRSALAALERDGLVERDPADLERVRLALR